MKSLTLFTFTLLLCATLHSAYTPLRLLPTKEDVTAAAHNQERLLTFFKRYADEHKFFHTKEELYSMLTGVLLVACSVFLTQSVMSETHNFKIFCLAKFIGATAYYTHKNAKHSAEQQTTVINECAHAFDCNHLEDLKPLVDQKSPQYVQDFLASVRPHKLLRNEWVNTEKSPKAQKKSQ